MYGLSAFNDLNLCRLSNPFNATQVCFILNNTRFGKEAPREQQEDKKGNGMPYWPTSFPLFERELGAWCLRILPESRGDKVNFVGKDIVRFLLRYGPRSVTTSEIARRIYYLY